MRHLKEEELIDLVDPVDLVDLHRGTLAESAAPHLASCEQCRAQLAELRAIMTAASGVEVPEPSPLFWDHLSARVRHAVANEAPSAGESAGLGSAARVGSWRVLLPGVALAALVLAAAIGLRGPIVPPGGDGAASGSPEMVNVDAGVDLAALFDADPALGLIADLVEELDWDDAVQAGLTADAGSVDRVVSEMTEDERLELRRLLNAELARHGA